MPHKQLDARGYGIDPGGSLYLRNPITHPPRCPASAPSLQHRGFDQRGYIMRLRRSPLTPIFRATTPIGAGFSVLTPTSQVTADAWVAKAGDGGSDSNNGLTEQTPKLTINAGFTVLGSLGGGKKLIIKSGTYVEDLTNESTIPSGSASGHTKVHAYPGHMVITKPSTGRNQSGHVLNLSGKSYVEFNNIEFDCDWANVKPDIGVGYAAIRIAGGTHMRFSECVLHDCNSSMILVQGDDHEFLNLEVYHASLDLDYVFAGNCLYIGIARRNIVAGGYYHDCVRGGGVRFGQSGGGLNQSTDHVCRNVWFDKIESLSFSPNPMVIWDNDHTIYNCIFSDCNGVWIGSSDDANRVRLYNCTFFNSQPGGLNGVIMLGNGVNDTAADCELKNLVFRSCQGPLVSDDNVLNITYSKLQAESAAPHIDVVANCNFVSENPASSDFLKLSSTSGGRNTGIDTGPTVTTDFIGTVRPKGGTYDIGAYEFDE